MHFALLTVYRVLFKSFIYTYRKQVQATIADAERDGVIVPTTLQEYCVSGRPKTTESHTDLDYYDEDDVYLDDEEEDHADDDEGSGNDES